MTDRQHNIPRYAYGLHLRRAIKMSTYTMRLFQLLSVGLDLFCSLTELHFVWFQTLVFDLKGQPVREQDELKIFVKDWERVGRNRSV